MDERTLDELQDKLVPGMELYHRGKHVRDLVHAYGKIRLISFGEKGLKCMTREGEITFPIDEINKRIYFHKEDSTSATVVGEDNEMTEQEREAYKPADMRIFMEEKAVYGKVRGHLDEMIRQIRESKEKIAREFNDYSETSDAHATDRQQQVLFEEEQLETIRKKPYYARIKLHNYTLTDFYISDQEPPVSSPCILNWRDPICRLYYTTNSVEREKYGLELLRRLEIYAGELVGYSDAYPSRRDQDADEPQNGGIIDEYLLRVLEQRRKSHDSRNIIQTIQDRQYQLISLPAASQIEVQGCAGSGKTVILLHRIAWLMHNQPDMKPENILIITPNRNLNMDLEALSTRLQLFRIPRQTISEAYRHLIYTIMKDSGLTESPMGDSDSLNHQNDYDPVLSPAIWEKAYGGKVMEQFRAFRESKRDLIELTRLSGCIAEHRVNGKTRREFVADFRRATRTLAQCGEETTKLLNKYECASLVESLQTIRNRKARRVRIIQLLTKLQRTDSIEGALRKQQSLSVFLDSLSADKSLQLDFDERVQERERLEKAYADLQELDRDELALESLASRLELYFKSKVLPGIGRQEADFTRFSIPRKADRRAADWLLSTYRNLSRSVAAIDAFEKGEDRSYLCVIWSLFREDWKRRLGLDVGRTYLFEWYQTLCFMLAQFGPPSVRITHLMIDEAQDYAGCEVNLLIEALGHPVINSYGDVEQRIRNIPAPYFFPSEEGSAVERYEIDVNYRNAEEITLKTNERCGTSMRPLGLNGAFEFVAERNLAAAMGTAKDIHDSVLIVKNTQALAQAVESWGRYIERPVISEDGVEYPDDRIPVVTIEEVKGREFPHAVVWEKGMVARERYIAYTRAQRKLTVVV